MKLGWNLAAGFANSAWTAIIGLAVVPFYLRYLGIEAYGLIGFFTAIQALFALLDLGLSPTINREVARTTGSEDQSEVRNLLHTLALFFWAAAALIGVATVAAAPVIGRSWLTSSKLQVSTITQAVMLMGLIAAFRFPVGLYMGVLMGAQRMVVASGLEMATITIANVGAIAVLAWVSPTIQAFFLWQAVAAGLNVAIVRWAAWKTLRDRTDVHARPRFDSQALQRIWRFSAGMAATAVLGTIFLQSDKIVLSKIVSLEALGRYTLAGMAVRSLYLFVTPAFGAVYPRMTTLQATGKTPDIRILYKTGTRLLISIIAPIGVFVTIFSTELFTLWTNNAVLARNIEPLVGLLLIGTIFHGAMHFPFALQLAYGKSHLPMMINSILAVVFIPLVMVLAFKDGVVGAAAAWAILNGVYLLLGTWITHKTLLPREGGAWLLGDVAFPLVCALAITGPGCIMIEASALGVYSRLTLGGLLAMATFLLLVALSPELASGFRRIQTLAASGAKRLVS